ncbi:MAG: hypothetical protein KDN18_03645, partial [Verrucomicrobiae bacterium]|nr:hypothetical protein [Verrucomicrobiae bacterium]
MKTLILLPVVLVCLLVSPGLEARTWTEAASGRTVEGEFRRLSGDSVEVLRTNGTLLKLPLSKLSEADQ